MLCIFSFRCVTIYVPVLPSSSSDRREHERFCNLPSTLIMSTLNLDEEVRLYTTNAEREKYGLLATLFGVIVALEYLERAYVRDSVTASE